MPGRTYRIICLWFAVLLGIEQLWLTWTTGSMYVPPAVLLTSMAALMGGLIGKSWIERPAIDAQTTHNWEAQR